MSDHGCSLINASFLVKKVSLDRFIERSSTKLTDSSTQQAGGVSGVVVLGDAGGVYLGFRV